MLCMLCCAVQANTLNLLAVLLVLEQDWVETVLSVPSAVMQLLLVVLRLFYLRLLSQSTKHRAHTETSHRSCGQVVY